jgi:hypothetical protein
MPRAVFARKKERRNGARAGLRWVFVSGAASRKRGLLQRLLAAGRQPEVIAAGHAQLFYGNDDFLAADTSKPPTSSTTPKMRASWQ